MFNFKTYIRIPSKERLCLGVFWVCRVGVTGPAHWRDQQLLHVPKDATPELLPSAPNPGRFFPESLLLTGRKEQSTKPTHQNPHEPQQQKIHKKHNLGGGSENVSNFKLK